MASNPHPVDVEVGRRIFVLRRRLRLSRSILAEAAGVSFQQIQKYETGANRISSSRLALIADRLGTSPAALFGPEPASPPLSEADALLDAFRRIPDPERRRSLLSVAQAMADRALPPLPAGPSPA